jgi:hypothetical protein
MAANLTLGYASALALLLSAPAIAKVDKAYGDPDARAQTDGEAARHWTLADQLTVPRLWSIAIAADGKSAAYVTRVADAVSDTTLSRLTLVDLESGSSRELLRASWVDQLRRIPGSAAWSALIDRGNGVQLYRIEPGGHIAPMVTHPATARFGDVEDRILPGYAHAPLTIGVRAYSWSPDGRKLFFITLDSVSDERQIQIDEKVSDQRGLRRQLGQATASLYLRAPDGKVTLSV